MTRPRIVGQALLCGLVVFACSPASTAFRYQRPWTDELVRRLREPRRFLQVVAGSRQVGKTTLAGQAAERSGLPARYASADEPTLRGGGWIEQQWEAARGLAAAADAGGALLVLDEVQKVPRWPETVKRLWDADTRADRRLKVVLLGSAPLLVDRGLSESLAGRFEMLRLPHWSFAEMRAAFGWPLERYLFHGGYPGAAPLVGQPERWTRYVRDSLIEPIISRDVLLLSRVDKPALVGDCEVHYWRERNREVDFVVRRGRTLAAVEVKSGRAPDTLPGMAAFSDAFGPARQLLVGGDGIDVGSFLATPVTEWLRP